MRTSAVIVLVAALGGANALGGLFGGGRPSRAQQDEARAAFRENMPPSCHEHFDDVEECVKARFGDEDDRQSMALAMMGKVRGCANEGGCNQFGLFRIIMDAKNDADNGVPVELPQCVAEGLGQSPREYMADCLGREAKPEGGKMLMMKHLMSRRDELRAQCDEPDAFKSCMKRMIRGRKSEICDSPCMREPPRQCKEDLAEMRNRVCSCAKQMKGELTDVCSSKITNEMSKHAAGKMARCDREPREWSDGKPAMCHEDDDEDEEQPVNDAPARNSRPSTRRCNRACQRRRQRQRQQGRK